MEYAPGYDRGTCTPMFIAALFTTAKLWKQARCPMNEEWFKRHLHTHAYCGTIHNNQVMETAKMLHH
jgi:hypothetical protein